jgi:hypothetical protein
MKIRKQKNSNGEVPSQGRDLENVLCFIEFGKRRKIVSPPIHVSIPYQPQPTKALKSVGI